MKYTPKTKEWFEKRIGWKVYRDDQGCTCRTCARISQEGLIVEDESHADYLACIDADFAADGIYSNYRDRK